MSNRINLGRVVGKNAYEVAMQNGFVGNETAWLASLKGAQGVAGPKGDKGDTGATGPAGVTGPKGDKGDNGTASVAIDDTITNATQTWSSEKIAAQAIKTNYMEMVPGNLVNPSEIETGKYYSTTGVLTTQASFSTTGLIPVKPNTAYAKSGSTNLTYWDSSGTFISGASIGNFTTPSNASFIRSSIANAAVSTFMIVEGSTLPSSFIPYAYKFKIPKENYSIELASGSVLDDHIAKGVSLNKIAGIDQGGVNLFNKNDLEFEGKYYTAAGVLTTLNGYGSSKLIPVEVGKMYKKTWVSEVSFWGVNGDFISGLTGSTSTSFIIPNNATHMRTSLRLTDPITSFMLYKSNNVIGTYIPFNKNKSLLNPRRFEFKQLKPNADIPLFVETYLEGGNQPIHPSVVKFATAWNGYKYWMAYTPYPNGQPATENPCIAASDDLIKWVTPAGLTNPIAPSPSGTSMQNYNSDTHLVFNSTTNTLECWYREITNNTTESIIRKTSTNGVTWNAAQVVMSISGAANVKQLISPAVLFRDGKYRMYVMRDSYVIFFESTDAITWGEGVWCYLGDGTTKIYTWHFDVMYNTTKGIYEMINNENGSTTTANGGVLTHYTSTDGINWKREEFLMLPSFGTNRFDNVGLYRGSLVFEGNKYYLIYTGINTLNKWQIGLSISKDDDIMTLEGVDSTYKSLMAQPTRKNPMGEIGDSVYDTSLNKMIYCVDKNGSKTWIDAIGTVI